MKSPEINEQPFQYSEQSTPKGRIPCPCYPTSQHPNSKNAYPAIQFIPSKEFLQPQ